MRTTAMLVAVMVGMAVLPASLAAQPTTQPAGGFATPIWHPDARFEVVHLGGAARLFYNAIGYLDGPTLEMETNSLGMLGPGYLNSGEGGKTFYGWYDQATGRAHKVAGAGWGYLDGPFSRARFGNKGYTWSAPSFGDNEGRYLFIVDRAADVLNLRCLDFDKQEVRTVVRNLDFWGAKGFRGLAAKADGNFYLLTADGNLALLDSKDGRNLGNIKLDIVKGALISTFIRTFPVALDETNNRLYCGHDNAEWYIYYWDLKDGSFHGVMPKPKSNRRPRNQPGPFEGMDLYHECGVLTFGPDDPARRFLYMTRVDTWQLFRLDLENKEIAALKYEPTERGKPAMVSFSTSKADHVAAYNVHRWMLDGSGVVSIGHSPTTCTLFRRVK